MRDIPQGGLEIPCQLTFEGDEKYFNKVKKLMKSDTNSNTDACSSTVYETVSVATADAAGNCGSSNDKEKYVQVEDVDENDKNKKGKLTIYG